jgi:serine/threonine protein kinase
MADDSVLLAQLADEFADRVRRGLLPSIEEFAARHPALAGRIRALFPTLLLLEGMAGGPSATADYRPAAPGGPEPGAEFGGYCVAREIGRGGMGVVYEAVHLALGRRVALKVLPVAGPNAGERLERFLREARTAAGLHHTNIVPVFDVGRVDGTAYYAMQFIDGTPLDAVLRRPRPPASPAPAPLAGPPTASAAPADVTRTASPDPAATRVRPPDTPAPGLPAAPPAMPEPPELTPRFVADVGAQAADGLGYAHDRGVVHRDVKPSNLIRDAAGVVWITDFGLARRLDDASLTRTGQLLGTPRYMSPEQAEASARPIDHRTDVYSLGATLYELLTRRPAFDGKTPQEVVGQILTREPVAPRRLDASIPRDLETVVMKAMAKRPADRYASAHELGADLRRFLAGEPVSARRISPVGRAWRWARRNPAVASLLGAVLVVFAAGAGVSAYYARQAELRAKDADDNATLAGQKEALARTLADLAGRREAEANTERLKTLTAAGEIRRRLHAARMNVAAAAFREGRYSRVAEILGETFPASGGEDLRGWEWHYLFRQIFAEAPASSQRPWPKSEEGIRSADGRRRVVRDKGHLIVSDVASGREAFRVTAKDPGGGWDREQLALSPTGDVVAAVPIGGTYGAASWIGPPPVVTLWGGTVADRRVGCNRRPGSKGWWTQTCSSAPTGGMLGCTASSGASSGTSRPKRWSSTARPRLLEASPWTPPSSSLRPEAG